MMVTFPLDFFFICSPKNPSSTPVKWVNQASSLLWSKREKSLRLENKLRSIWKSTRRWKVMRGFSMSTQSTTLISIFGSFHHKIDLQVILSSFGYRYIVHTKQCTASCTCPKHNPHHSWYVISRAALVPHPYLAFSKKMVQLRPSQCQTILRYGQPTVHVQNTDENAVVATMRFLTHYHSLCMTKSIPERHSTTIHGTGMRVSFILITPLELDSHLQTIKKVTQTTLTKVPRIYLRLCNSSTNFSQNTKTGKLRFTH